MEQTVRLCQWDINDDELPGPWDTRKSGEALCYHYDNDDPEHAN